MQVFLQFHVRNALHFVQPAHLISLVQLVRVVTFLIMEYVQRNRIVA